MSGISALEAAETVGQGVIGQQCDVSDPTAKERLADFTSQHFGGLDLLVNNAGFAHTGQRIHEYDVHTWNSIIAVNVRGACLTVRYLIPLMLQSGGGAIVNMGSIGSIRPVARSSAYIVSKGAVLMLTRQAAIEYLQGGIRVNIVAPGPLETPIVIAAGEAVIASLKARVPMHILGQPEDAAAVTLFLLSEEARFTTGAVYTAAGGLEAF